MSRSAAKHITLGVLGYGLRPNPTYYLSFSIRSFQFKSSPGSYPDPDPDPDPDTDTDSDPDPDPDFFSSCVLRPYRDR
jgi:hypothetical protein